MFQDSSLSRQTNKMVYQAVVMGMLLWVAETWPAKQKDIRSLELGLSPLLSETHSENQQSIASSMSSISAVKRCGNDMRTLLAILITSRRLQWLGHVAQMDDLRLPKQFLYLTHILHTKSN